MNPIHLFKKEPQSHISTKQNSLNLTNQAILFDLTSK